LKAGEKRVTKGLPRVSLSDYNKVEKKH